MWCCAMNSMPSNSQLMADQRAVPQYYLPEETPTQGASDLIRILLKRKNWIVGTALVFAMLAAAYAFGRDREYTAIAQILVDPRGVNVLDRDMTPRVETSDGSIAIVESQMRILTSNTVLGRVIDRQNLTNDPEFAGPKPGVIAAFRRFIKSLTASSEPVDVKLKVLHELQENIRTKRPKFSYVINLHVKSIFPEKTARIANGISNTYLQIEAEQRAGLAGRASEMLTARLGELKQQLNDAEAAVERYMVDNNILNTNGALFNEQELSESNQLLIQASGSTATALAKLEQVRALRRSGQVSQSLPEAVASNTIMRLRDRYAAARQRQQALSAQLLPNHPRMLATQAEVNSARSAINAELARIADVAKTEYDRALANQRKIENRIAAMKGDAFKTKDAMVRLRELQRDANSKRAVYESFLVRARELGEQQSVNTSSAQIVSPAVVPIEPSDPSSLLIVALGLVAGTGLGSILAFGREAVGANTTTWKLPGFGMKLPVLASVPVYQADLAEDGLPAFVTDHPYSPSARAIGDLLDALRPNGPASNVRTVLVTSPGANHGKTTVSLNLALAAARRGEKVLLIDGDLDNCSLSFIRLGNPTTGLTDVIAGTSPLQDALLLDKSRLIMTMPSGRVFGAKYSPAITAGRFEETILRKLPEFTFVVIDGPSVVSQTQTLSQLGNCADVIFMVVRSGEADERSLNTSVASLNGHRDKYAGSVYLMDAG